MTYGLMTVNLNNRETIHDLSDGMLVYKRKIISNGLWSNRPNHGSVTGPLASNTPSANTLEFAKKELSIYFVIKPADGKVIYMSVAEPEEIFITLPYVNIFGAATLWLVDKADTVTSSNYGISVYNKSKNALIFNAKSPQVKINDIIHITNSNSLPVYSTTIEKLPIWKWQTGVQGEATISVNWFYKKTFTFNPAIIPIQQYSEFTKEISNGKYVITRYTLIFKVTGKTIEIGKAVESWINMSWFPPTPRLNNKTLFLIIDADSIPNDIPV